MAKCYELQANGDSRRDWFRDKVDDISMNESMRDDLRSQENDGNFKKENQDG